jgi:hypothetical protein
LYIIQFLFFKYKMSCDTSTCYDSVAEQSTFQSIRLQNYTGRDVTVNLAVLKTDVNGKPMINARGVYQVSSVSSDSVIVPPTLSTAAGQYGIVGGLVAPYNGFIATTTDGEFTGIISTSGLTMDSGCCQDYWVSIGLKSGSTTVLVNSQGTQMDKPGAFYLLPALGGLVNAHQSGVSFWWVIVLLIILAVVAAVVALVYRNYTK